MAEVTNLSNAADIRAGFILISEHRPDKKTSKQTNKQETHGAHQVFKLHRTAWVRNGTKLHRSSCFHKQQLVLYNGKRRISLRRSFKAIAQNNLFARDHHITTMKEVVDPTS